MSRIRAPFLPCAAIACCISLLAAPAEAYVGPGLGLGAVGVLLALVAAVVFTVAGFIWYPMKKLLGLRRRRGSDEVPAGGAEGGGTPAS